MAYAFLILASLAPYAAALRGNFVYDDHFLVENTSPSTPGWLASFDAGLWRDLPAAGYYRPLVTLSFALDHYLGRGTPLFFHLTNLVLHLLLVLSGWKILEQLAPTRNLALPASLLFAVHPVHVEAVAWISGRGDLLAPLLGLLAWHAYLKGGWSGGRQGSPSRLWLASAGVLFLLALLSKESAVALPGLLLLTLLAPGTGPRAGGSRPSQVWPAAVLLAALAAALSLRLSVLGSFRGSFPVDPLENPAAGLGLLDRVATSAGAFMQGLKILAWPLHLTFDYAPPVLGASHLNTFRGVVSVSVLVGLVCSAALLLYMGRRRDSRWLPLGYGLGWMLVAWLPVSSLGPMPGTLLGERFLLMPSWGWSVMVVAGLGSLPRLLAPLHKTSSRWQHGCLRVPWVLLALLLTLMAGRAWRRVPDWRDDDALLSAALSTPPISHRVRFFEGLRDYRQGQLESAVQAFSTALASAPGFSRAHEALARTFLRLGETQRAAAEARQAIATEPPVARLRSRYRVLMAECLQKSSQAGDAEQLLREAARLDPSTSTPLRRLGDLRFASGAMTAAETAYLEALSRQPQDAVTLYNLAMTRSHLGREEAAVQLLRRLVLLHDAPRQALFQLGLREHQLGRPQRAADAFRAFLKPGTEQISQTMRAEARRQLKQLDEEILNLPAESAPPERR